MSMWDMLTYMEVSNANSKLEDISRENREHRENQLEQEMNLSISSLFQELYNVNNDVSKINLGNIFKIKDYINSQFNIRKYNTNKPKYDFGMIVFTIILSIIIYFISTAMLVEKDDFTIQWIILLVAGFFLFGSILYVVDNRKERKNFDSKINNFNKELPLLKIQFPDLSAFGVYLKWYLDSQCKNVIDILKKQNKDKNPYETLQIFYTLFDLNADPTMNYNWNLVYNFNKELIENFDSLSQPNLEKVGNDSFIETIVYYANGNIYTGRLKNGLPDGNGNMIFTDGCIYDGEWKNGVENGQAFLDCPTHTYQGEFKNGMKNGKGKAILENGIIFEGYFKNNDFIGKQLDEK